MMLLPYLIFAVKKMMYKKKVPAGLEFGVTESAERLKCLLVLSLISTTSFV